MEYGEGIFEGGDEALTSIKCGELLKKSSDRQLLINKFTA
jgi:hypothetical protein